MTIERYNWRGVDVAREISEQRLSHFDGFHRIIFQPNTFKPSIDVYIFFETEDVKERCVRSSCAEEVRLVVLEELSRCNFGPENGRSAIFHIDSHENVVENYRGEYYFRLL